VKYHDEEPYQKVKRRPGSRKKNTDERGVGLKQRKGKEREGEIERTGLAKKWGGRVLLFSGRREGIKIQRTY